MQNETARLDVEVCKVKLFDAWTKLMECRLQPNSPERDRKLAEIDALVTSAKRAVAWDCAVGLAYSERTGEEPDECQPYTAADAARADEIMAQCYPK